MKKDTLAHAVSDNPLQITFENLSYSVNTAAATQDTAQHPASPAHKIRALFSKGKATQKKQILKDLTGTFRPGRLTVILGPSGSGKTTLLNLLAGHVTEGTVDGKVWLNGRPAIGSVLRQVSGYVNQDDVMLPTQTVKEAIDMSVVLRPALEDASPDTLPPPATARPTRKNAARDEQVSRRELAISAFGLGKARNTTVGDSVSKGISGGERKRTAIAMEWVTQAPILFLDEPTSGLDAYSALAVVQQLRSVAQAGKPVVAVLHQPSSEIYALIDDLVLLSDGQIVYMGECAKFVAYMDRIGYVCPQYSNPADFAFNKLLFDAEQATATAWDCDDGPATARVDRTQYLVDMWKSSDELKALIANIKKPCLSPILRSQLKRMSPFRTQFWYLLKRARRNAIRNRLVIQVRIGQSIIFGLLIGFVFMDTDSKPAQVQVQNFSGAIFFASMAMILMTSIAVLNSFSGERSVFLREYRAGYYRLPAYFLAKNLVELPVQIVSPILFSCICYWLIGFRSDGVKFLLFMITTIVESVCGFSLGILLGCAVADLATALALLPIMILPFVLFGGLLVNTGNSTVWLRWLQWLSPIKYGYTSMSINQFSGYRIGGLPVGDSHLKSVDLGPFSIGVCIVFIIMLTAVFWVAGFLFLWRLTSKRDSVVYCDTPDTPPDSSIASGMNLGLIERRHMNAPLLYLLGPPDPRFMRDGSEK